MRQVCAAAVGANSLCAVPAETLARKEKALEQPLRGVLVRLEAEARTRMAPNLTTPRGQDWAKDLYVQIPLLFADGIQGGQEDRTPVWEWVLNPLIFLDVRPESAQILLAGRNARRKLCHRVDELRHGWHCGKDVLERRSRHGARHNS